MIRATLTQRCAQTRRLLDQPIRLLEAEDDPLATGPICFDYSIERRAEKKREELGARGQPETMQSERATASSARR